jgi:eukaryotic-like serine/threonine-protein kinase
MDAHRLKSLFDSALELSEPERSAFIEEACAGDAELLVQLRKLLTMDARLAHSTMRPLAPALTRMVAAASPMESWTGLRVGAFELREELGRGGMGSVYRAERVDGSLVQQAAIKFVRRELLDANSLRRFQTERQTLASLDHPNIARLLDGAELADGTPYFVMEYVDGIPISEYCQRRRLDARQCVALFRTVCAAVMQAHRNLVVHRDLKPGNILVTAAGVPKLLDFGIAKPLTLGHDGPASEMTGTAQRYFSPLYSAPEQLLGGAIGVGCDVYALGLLLYELLAGARPFDFTGLSAGQVERVVTTVLPIAPSAAAARVGATPLQQRQLRGDLDGIVLRCLRKAADERYASVEQLDADLANYLDGLPVRARGGHGWYRAQKFLRRNFVAVSLGALAIAALLAGVVAFAWQARIASQRATDLEQVARFQAGMLAQVNPHQAGRVLSNNVQLKFEQALIKAGVPEAERAAQIAAFAAQWRQLNATDAARELIDSTILEPAVTAIDKEFAQQPLVDAALRQVLADRYVGLGSFDAAMTLQQSALQTRQQELGDRHPDTLYSLNAMGNLLSWQGRFDESEPFIRMALSGRQGVLGADDPMTLESLNDLVALLLEQGRAIEGEAFARELVDKQIRVQGENHPATLTAMHNLSMLLREQGRMSDAEHYMRRSLEGKRKVLGADNYSTLNSLNILGLTLLDQDKLSEAESCFRDALERRRRVLGEEHPDTILSIMNMGLVLRRTGNFEEAEQLTRESLDKHLRVLGPDHPVTTLSLANMGLLLQAQGRLSEAEPVLVDALEKRRLLFGAKHRRTLKSLSDLGGLRVAMGRFTQAAELLATAEPVLRETYATGSNRFFAEFLIHLGRARTGVGAYADAESNLLEAHRELGKADSANMGNLHESMQALHALYIAWNGAEPGHGHDVQAVVWQRRLEAHARDAAGAASSRAAANAGEG